VLERTVEGDRARYVLRVEQAYKGDLSGRVEVVTAADGAACGLSADEGDRLGLLLERSGGEWRSGLCSQVDPADFLALSNVEDNQLPVINWGGYLVGFAVLALAAWLLWRRRRRYTAR
jgi:LPXTG-motif cell wall-anchored protein